jgi:hypothetical protein
VWRYGQDQLFRDQPNAAMSTTHSTTIETTATAIAMLAPRSVINDQVVINVRNALVFTTAAELRYMM